MTIAAGQNTRHIDESKGASVHDHDINMSHELSKQLDAAWRYNQNIASGSEHKELEVPRGDFKAEELQNVTRLKAIVQKHVAELKRKHLGELTQAREQEQERIAQELHDGQSSLLTGINLQVYALRMRLEKLNLPVEALESDCISQQLCGAIKQLRSLVKGLHPLGIDYRSFIEALRSLVIRTRATKSLKVRFLTTSELVKLPNAATANHLYRIAQEAVQNVLRHSGATHLAIQLNVMKGALLLSISDNGCGFEPEESNDGLGMRTMRSRAFSVGGTLTIEPRKGGGVRVICRVPLGAK